MRSVAALVALLVLVGAAGSATTATAPPPPSSVRFAVKGDWGTGSTAQGTVTRRMCAEYRRSPFAFVLTTGDNFYQPDGVATAATFTRPERCLTDLGVTWHAVWGNHDIAGTSTADVLGSPTRYYAFVAGPARILVLDGNDPSDPGQLQFIRDQLRDATEPVRIVAFHQPIRTAGLHAPADEARRLWEPLLRRGRVTLVLQGHNHLYERIVAGGITYITTGGGGAPLYPCLRPATGLRRCVVVHHFLAVNVSRSRVSVRAVSSTGATIERVVIPARSPA